MNDYVVMSLSDLLTPWEVIEKRVECAARGDFVIVLYNPRSKKRVMQLEVVKDILLRWRAPDTPVGIARKIGDQQEEACITTLENMLNHHIDMETTLIIGNSKTAIFGGYMVTPRGYARKFERK